MTNDQIIALLSKVFNNNLFIVAAGFAALKLWGAWTRSDTLIIQPQLPSNRSAFS